MADWWVPLLVLGVVLLIGAESVGSARERARTAGRIASIERTVDAIAAHLGVTVPDPQPPEVLSLLAEGKDIAAVKAYREATGADLRTAKEAVDELARRR